MTDLPTPSSAQPVSRYMPGLDGLRAVSVIAVVLYHAGFGWAHGGFFGVEVFFVISGFLITSLLIDERAATGGVSLRRFWARRARRLLPALATLLIAVTVWAVLAGSDEQVVQLRHDVPWALVYAANWGQILSDAPYFAPIDPPLLRHLWSLAVEEQWYVVWPLTFLGVARIGRRGRGAAAIAGAGASASVVLVWWLQRGGSDRINTMYLSTPTRASGLLIGAATAFAWSDRAAGERPGGDRSRSGGVIAVLGATAMVGLAASFVVGDVQAAITYPWLMLAVSTLSVIATVAVVRPRRTWFDRLIANRPLAALGRRSYGIYLWHWPVFVVAGATAGSWWRFALAIPVAAALSELCFRYVEMPIRHGALTGLWSRRRRFVLAPAAGTVAVAAVLAVFVADVDPVDRAVGGAAAEFELTSGPAAESTSPATVPSTSVGAPPAPEETANPVGAVIDAAGSTTPTTPTSSAAATTSPPAPPTTAPRLPRRLAIVGDSQAHSIAVNAPRGIGNFFAIVDGSVDGCSVHETGRVVSELAGFDNDFGICRDWADEWADAASDADVALVVLGAWDVFDLDFGGMQVTFGSAEYDELFLDRLGTGLDAIRASGARAALLEVACMRPVEARGAGVPPLPERGDDARVAHLNDLLRRAADADPAHVTFIDGPDEWCRGDPLATDRAYRWDGVHVYQRGAKLILETIAPELLSIPVEA